MGCRLWGRTESDTTEVIQQQQQQTQLKKSSFYVTCSGTAAVFTEANATNAANARMQISGQSG